MGLAPEQILADLVVIPSVTGDWGANEAALDYVENHLVGLGMHVERPTYAETIGDRPTADYGVLIATTTTTKMPKVMLSAHVDVVPGPPRAV